ncbi:MAG TPA: MbnP family protein [Ferruginibacter sp.]|nr:MbnP family protein [Ferruginibacter sp.]
MKNRPLLLPIFLTIAFVNSSFQSTNTVKEQTGTLKITFINTVKGTPLQLHEGRYTNPFAEQYTVSKFKYYISNIAVAFPDGILTEKESYHLIDESKPGSLSFSFYANVNTYHSLLFMLGVDSIMNVSGAQTGALDPLNDMFWTWNTGYVMAKMEGNSASSSIVNNKIEYHIGGFLGTDNVLKKLKLNFPAGQALEIREGKTSEIIIEADLDKWWKDPNDLKIANNALCTTAGSLAKQIADNYSKMFSIKHIINN